jgi:hypothetical protein
MTPAVDYRNASREDQCCDQAAHHADDQRPWHILKQGLVPSQRASKDAMAGVPSLKVGNRTL